MFLVLEEGGGRVSLLSLAIVEGEKRGKESKCERKTLYRATHTRRSVTERDNPACLLTVSKQAGLSVE